MDITTQQRFNMEALRTLISQALNLPSKNIFIAGKQFNVSNLSWFITLQRTGLPVIGYSSKFNGDNENEFQKVHRESLVTINYYGDMAMEWIEKLEASLRLTHYEQQLKKSGLGFVSASPVQDLSGALAGGYESRASIGITFSHTQIIQTHTNRISSAEVQIIKEYNE